MFNQIQKEMKRKITFEQVVRTSLTFWWPAATVAGIYLLHLILMSL